MRRSALRECVISAMERHAATRGEKCIDAIINSLAAAWGAKIEPDEPPRPRAFTINGNDVVLAWFDNGVVMGVARVDGENRDEKIRCVEQLIAAYVPHQRRWKLDEFSGALCDVTPGESNYGCIDLTAILAYPPARRLIERLVADANGEK